MGEDGLLLRKVKSAVCTRLKETLPCLDLGLTQVGRFMGASTPPPQGRVQAWLSLLGYFREWEPVITTFSLLASSCQFQHSS